MRQLITGNSVLNRVYLLISLLVLMAILIAIVLVSHNHRQQSLFNQISNYHAPTIYYTDKLVATLQRIELTFQQHQQMPENAEYFVEAVRNPAYSIKSYINAINELDGKRLNTETENSLLRLQREINNLIEVLNDFAINHDAHSELLPVLIQSANFRAQQFSRLHANANEELRQKLAEQAHDNAALLIKLTLVTVVAGGFLVVPMLLSIRNMIKRMHLSERQQREFRELAEKEQSRMASLLSAMSIGILFEDKQNRVEYINPAFIRMWALSEDKSLIGQPLNQILEDSPQRFTSLDNSSKFVLQVMDTHEISERFEIDFNDGRIRRVDGFLCLFRITFVFSVFRLVSRRCHII